MRTTTARTTAPPTRGERFGRKLLRSAQVWMPGARDARLRLERTVLGALHRPHERDFEALPLLGIPPGALIVDVGGNVGQSVDSIRLVCPDARIVSFEPNPWCAVQLRRHTVADPKVCVEPVGLGDETAERTLHIPVYGRYRFDGLASFDRAMAADWLGPDTIVGFRPGRLRIETVTCRTRRLDDFGLAPVFVKIDVQGLELDVIRGGLGTIDRHRPVLMVEAMSFDGALADLLGPLGYEMYRFVHPDRFVRVDGHGDNTFLIPEARRSTVRAEVVTEGETPHPGR